jgi:hypothetical protein
MPFSSTPEIPESPPAPPRFGRENSRDFPDPDMAGIGKPLYSGFFLPRSRFGRDPGKIAGITPRLNGIVIGIGTLRILSTLVFNCDRKMRPKCCIPPPPSPIFGTTSERNLNSLFIMNSAGEEDEA